MVADLRLYICELWRGRLVPICDHLTPAAMQRKSNRINKSPGLPTHPQLLDCYITLAVFVLDFGALRVLSRPKKARRYRHCIDHAIYNGHNHGASLGGTGCHQGSKGAER
ncbi:hypothetical protein FIBSPDRAFT_91567 [Athelia psychrophila]|uniref:Uncharacterized protein n=1 Tax=Athelia psychrophila TaxID=1759441 RepID=A0A166TIY2_9AGAM|nr:hypothetical protein FIBSPDRAFT_91567 [Fibularhizoctonia sp. CBS 109695]